MLSYMLPPVLEEKPPSGSESSSPTSSVSTNASGHQHNPPSHNHPNHHHAEKSNRTKLHLHFLNEDDHISNDNYLRINSINERFPKDSSLSSFNSSNDTVTNFTTSSSTAPTKNPSLKRVSFGSSKGSMVETLIYESPTEDDTKPLIDNNNCEIIDSENFDVDRSKVRVSFFQQTEPQSIASELFDLIDANQHSQGYFSSSTNCIMSNHRQIVMNGGASCQFDDYKRQESAENGWENPFRPDGELSREADEIVQMIKGGKPITPTSPLQEQRQFQLEHETDGFQTQKNTNSVGHVNGKQMANSANSNKTNKSKLLKNGTSPNMEPMVTGNTIVNNESGVQRDKMVAGQSSDIEHIIVKKKSRCKCCVLQ